MTATAWVREWAEETDERRLREIARLEEKLRKANETIGSLKRQLAEAKGETWTP